MLVNADCASLQLKLDNIPIQVMWLYLVNKLVMRRKTLSRITRLALFWTPKHYFFRRQVLKTAEKFGIRHLFTISQLLRVKDSYKI